MAETTEKKARNVKKLGYLVLFRENTGVDLSVPSDMKPFATSKQAEEWIASNGLDVPQYFIVRIQRGPIRVKQTKTLDG